jgi:flavodoxin
MKVVVICESMYGNTHAVAEAIAADDVGTRSSV